MKTIKDLKDQNQWDELRYDDKLDIVINTLFMHGKINEEIEMSCGDYGEVIVELNCVEDDDKMALTEGWLSVKDDNIFQTDLHRGDCSHWYISDQMWEDLYTLLEDITDWS